MADVSIDATVSTATARGIRAVVFTTDQIGYVFYLDSDGVFGYSKTTDGGATWGAQVNVDGAAATTTVAFDVWYDRWTPGDTGALIHTWWFDVTNDVVRWRTLDPAADTLGTVRTVFTGASAVAGRGAFVSGTKTRSGYLYCAYDIDAGAEKGFHRSTDSGTTWSATLSATFVEATLDTCTLYPASGTGDDNDCWALYYDASALALTLKLWDSSAVAQVESATIGVAHTDGATDLTGQFGYSGAVRHSDGHLIVAALSARDVAASTHQVFDITSTSTITTKTAIAASTDDHYDPQVFIDQFTNNLYVAYNGKRDGSEVLDTTTKVYSTKSTDGGTTWSAGDTAYLEGAAGVVQQVWTPLMGPRFYAVWRVGTTLLGNKVNSLSLAPAQSVTGATIASGSVVRPPYIPITAPPISSFIQVNYYDQSLISPRLSGQFSFSDTFDPAEPTNQFGQSFHAAARFSAVEVMVYAPDSGGFPPGTWVLDIHAGDQLGTIVSTCSLPVVEVDGVFKLIRFAFPTVDPGGSSTLYTWTLRRDGADLGVFNARVLYAGSTTMAEGHNSYAYYGSWVSYVEWPYFTRVLSESVFAPTVAVEAGGADQAVTSTTLAAGSSVTAPTVAPGAVTVTGATVTSGGQVQAPTIAPGAVTITGTTLASGALVRAPTVTPGAVTVTGATVTSGVQVFAPTATAGAVAVSGATVTSGNAMSAPTVTPGAVTVLGATLTSTLQVFAPTVAQGVVTVSGATVASSLQAFAPTVTVGAVTISGAFIASSAVLRAPTAAGITAAGGTDQTFMWLV